MFTIIGGDGKEYGPVTADQVRAWIAGGRATLETKAKALGSEEWRRLGDYAEFGSAAPLPEIAAAETAATPVTAEFQPAGAVDAATFAKDAIARAAPLDIMGCIERAWELLKANVGALVGTTLLVICFEFIVSKLCGFVPGPRWEITPRISLGMDTWASVLLSAPIYGALNIYYLKKMRGAAVEVGDVFRAMVVMFVPLFLVGLVGTLITAAGFLLLFLPGIYFAVAYAFAKMLVVDHHMPFWTALEVSRRVISAQWFRMFGLVLLATFVSLLGLIGLIVGVFFTIPLLFGSLCYAYDDLCNPPRR
jgi:hypothetical protein